MTDQSEYNEMGEFEAAAAQPHSRAADGRAEHADTAVKDTDVSDVSAKVMIVDDASMTVRLMQAFLEDAGYTRFVTTSRSTEAMELLLKERPDVVLLDLDMPEVSGFDILRELRAHRLLKHIPVLILTAAEDAGSKLRALELGATDFLAKPVDTSELALRLRNTLAAKAYQDRLIFCDALTDLPNRRMFLDRFSDCLARSKRSGAAGAVLQIDLDRFRTLNDSLGYSEGDRLLRTIARRLASCIRDADEICRVDNGGQHASASRVGGNEFMMLLPDLDNVSDMTKVADRVLAAIAEPVPWDSGELVVTASIGIVEFPAQADSAEQLLCNLALATAQAKLRGRNRFEVFSRSCASAAPDLMRLEADLHRALDRDELRLFYQPKVCARSGKVTGSEALLRWQHSERGLVSPGEFIPLAEETGLIVQFGGWVIRTACARLAEWHADGWSELGVSVNVASLQLKDGNLPAVVEQALEDSGIEPARLTLELTESSVIENASQTLQTLDALQKLGVKLSLDDFGTGYSSLSYLDRLPITELKIDRCFVSKIDQPGDDAPILSAVIAMARHLGLQVVAEGVENEAQRDFLATHACDVYQGYWFAKPMPPGEFTDWLRGAANARFAPSSSAVPQLPAR